MDTLSIRILLSLASIGLIVSASATNDNIIAYPKNSEGHLRLINRGATFVSGTYKVFSVTSTSARRPVVITYGRLDKLLPEPLAQTLGYQADCYFMKKNILDFMNFVHQNASTDLLAVLSMLEETIAYVTSVMDVEDESYDESLPIALESFLYCYALSHAVCDIEQGTYIAENGLLNSISDLTLSIIGEPFEALQALTSAVLAEGRISESDFYHLSMSFLNALERLGSLRLMQGAFCFSLNTYVSPAIRILSDIKKDLLRRNQLFISPLHNSKKQSSIEGFTHLDVGNY